MFIDQFIASFDTPPRHLMFDLDTVDDPAHGHQQLTFCVRPERRPEVELVRGAAIWL